jgi:DNA-binding NarL/FixJ family response regulator
MNEKIKVLLVDDHALFRSGMRRLLSFYPDLEIIGEAGTGEEAVQAVTAVVPDVVLMDIDMPGEGGVAATVAIRAHCPPCRVLVLTGHRHYVMAGLENGASGYVLKEADEDVIVDAIRTVHQGGVYLQPAIQALVVEALQAPGARNLSEREVNVLRFIAQGASNREIGEHLMISEDRVKQHIKIILHILQANDRTHAVAIAIREGII